MPLSPTAAAYPEACVRSTNGTPVLHVNGQPYAPFFLMTSPSVMRQLQGLGLRDVRLITFEFRDEQNGRAPFPWWTGIDQYDFATVARCLQDFRDAMPDAWFIPRILLDPPAAWYAAHPDDMIGYADPRSWDDTGGWGGARKPSWASETWRRDAARALRLLIRHISGLPAADHLIGWHLGSGVWGEWHCPNPIYYPDTSKVFQAAYGDWLTQQYPNATPAPRIPGIAERRTASHGWLRDPVRDRWLIDYARFLHETGASALLHLAAVAKEETARRSLVMAFNGYLPELGTNHEADHRAFDRILASPDVDICSSPHTYGRRALGQDGMIRGFLGSVREHNKLWLDENDDRTHLTTPVGWQVAFTHVKTEAESRELLWRGFAQALTHECGLWFMDQKGLWESGDGPGWYGTPGMVADLNRMREIMTAAVTRPAPRVAEVAVFIDLASAFYVADTDHDDRSLIHRLYTDFMESLTRAGAPFDLYQIGDIQAAQQHGYRTYIFLDAFHATDARLAQLEALKAQGKTLLFCGAPASLSDTAFAPERTEALCIPADRRADFRRLLADPSPAAFENRAAEEEPWHEGNVWFNPGARLAPRHLRALYAAAGVHPWLASEDVLMAGGGFVALHAAADGDKTLTAPQPMTWTDVRADTPVARHQATLRLTLKRGETRLFAVH